MQYVTKWIGGAEGIIVNGWYGEWAQLKRCNLKVDLKVSKLSYSEKNQPRTGLTVDSTQLTFLLSS